MHQGLTSVVVAPWAEYTTTGNMPSHISVWLLP